MTGRWPPAGSHPSDRPPDEPMARIIFMNDRLVPEDEARVSVFDHGLLYGDGVFEGLRSYSGKVFRLDAHLDRLWAERRADLPADFRSRRPPSPRQ